MEFVNSDGGRSKYFKGQTGDCVTRAIVNATGKDYKEVYDKLANLTKAYASQKRDKVARSLRRKNQTSPRNGVHKVIYRDYLQSIGWKFVPTMKIGSGCTVHLKSEELPTGNLIVSVSGHLTCVKDGVLHDIYDCSRDEKRCVYGYYIRDESQFKTDLPMEFTASELMSKKFDEKPKQEVSKAELVDLKSQGFDDETISKLFNVKAEPKPRSYKFNQEQVKQNALKVMGFLDKLTQSERKRVLAHCNKINSL
tara:strand:- start:285 stop:1040 length:756 start_codon:yes stop_codon:yes gene_type:complete